MAATLNLMTAIENETNYGSHNHVPTHLNTFHLSLGIILAIRNVIVSLLQPVREFVLQEPLCVLQMSSVLLPASQHVIQTILNTQKSIIKISKTSTGKCTISKANEINQFRLMLSIAQFVNKVKCKYTVVNEKNSMINLFNNVFLLQKRK